MDAVRINPDSHLAVIANPPAADEAISYYSNIEQDWHVVRQLTNSSIRLA